MRTKDVRVGETYRCEMPFALPWRRYRPETMGDSWWPPSWLRGTYFPLSVVDVDTAARTTLGLVTGASTRVTVELTENQAQEAGLPPGGGLELHLQTHASTPTLTEMGICDGLSDQLVQVAVRRSGLLCRQDRGRVGGRDGDAGVPHPARIRCPLRAESEVVQLTTCPYSSWFDGRAGDRTIRTLVASSGESRSTCMSHVPGASRSASSLSASPTDSTPDGRSIVA